MTLFMCVSRDIYELPLCVEASKEELARKLHVSLSTIEKGLQRRWKGKKSCYVAVKVEDERHGAS